MTSIKSEKSKEMDKGIVQCPSCGKPVPKQTYCKKCGTSFKPEMRIATKSVLIFVLIVAGLGVGMLSYGYFVGNYITPISYINAGMEGNTIRIQGYVTEIEYWETYEKTTFQITDSSGSIQISGWSEFTSDIKEKGYPEIGDIVTVEGSVDVYEEEVSLELRNADSISITYQTVIQKDVGDIDADDQYKKVNITGEINDIDELYNGDLMIMELIDNDYNKIDVKITADFIAFTGAEAIVPEKYDDVQIIGMVDLYYDSPQIKPCTMTNKSIKIL